MSTPPFPLGQFKDDSLKAANVQLSACMFCRHVWKRGSSSWWCGQLLSKGGRTGGVFGEGAEP